MKVYLMPSVLVLSSLLSANFAFAASSACDSTMQGLLRNNGGCTDGKCVADVQQGQLKALAKGVGKIEIGDNYTTATGFTVSGHDEQKSLASAKIENGENGELKLTIVMLDENGKTLRNTYTFNDSTKTKKGGIVN